MLKMTDKQGVSIIVPSEKEMKDFYKKMKKLKRQKEITIRDANKRLPKHMKGVD